MLRFLAAIGSLSPYIIAFLIGGVGTFAWLNNRFFEPADITRTAPVSFQIEKGWNLKTIAKELENKKLLRHWSSVYYLHRLKDEGENPTVILPGEYKISASWSPKEILKTVMSGDIVYHEVRIPEGTRVDELENLMAKTTLVTREEARAALNNKVLMQRFEIPASSLEGYLFPATYKFTRPDDATIMVTRMITEGKKRFTKEMFERAIDLGFTFHQVLTLASIIEKETGDPSERELISAVFHNRLRIGMPLQSDPTVIYGIPNFNGNLTKADLNTPTPYNTYLNTGLPPTPICNPGMEAIKAALYPVDSDFLYFVAKGDTTHHFSATYKEHRKAVNKYQRGL